MNAFQTVHCSAVKFFCYFEQEETDKIGEMNDLTVTVAAQIAIAFLIVI